MSRKKNGVFFQLVKISTEQYADFRENRIAEEQDFDIAFNARIRIDKAQKVVGMFTKYQFDQSNKPVLVIECGCHFKIDEEYWNNSITENILSLDQGMLTHLLVLTVGTSRGILHAKKPKWLADLLLPTINVTDVIKEDYTLDLSIEDEEE